VGREGIVERERKKKEKTRKRREVAFLSTTTLPHYHTSSTFTYARSGGQEVDG